MSTVRKKAGPKPKYGGTYAIQNSRQLFEQSCAEGSPEYKYVALAIGSSPGAPPDWAMWACIEARQVEERSAARGIDPDIPAILDEIVRFYDRKQREFELGAKDALVQLDSYIVPSIREAIRDVLKRMGLRQKRDSRANDDWFRDIRNAWDWEQENDPSPDASDWTRLQGLMKKRDGTQVPIKATARIHRVLMETMARENGDPEDVDTWAWITKRAIEEQNIQRQWIGAPSPMSGPTTASSK